MVNAAYFLQTSHFQARRAGVACVMIWNAHAGFAQASTSTFDIQHSTFDILFLPAYLLLALRAQQINKYVALRALQLYPELRRLAHETDGIFIHQTVNQRFRVAAAPHFHHELRNGQRQAVPPIAC